MEEAKVHKTNVVAVETEHDITIVAIALDVKGLKVGEVVLAKQLKQIQTKPSPKVRKSAADTVVSPAGAAVAGA